MKPEDVAVIASPATQGPVGGIAQGMVSLTTMPGPSAVGFLGQLQSALPPFGYPYAAAHGVVPQTGPCLPPAPPASATGLGRALNTAAPLSNQHFLSTVAAPGRDEACWHSEAQV